MNCRSLITLIVILLSAVVGYSQQRKNIGIPDIPGYKTLKCDFHIHTVFSDGSVWPDIRVAEAWLEGLDAIAISDHIEYRPHSKDLVSDFNRSYDIALPVARQQGLLLVKAAEITRDMPPGHFNALFITNANLLDTEDVFDAINEAKNQGAFLIWNHPGWKRQQPDTTLWWAEHTRLYESGLLNGIEIYNDQEYYPEALNWANEKGLVIFSNTDIHNPVNLSYDLTKTHRPMTLVFAKDKSLESVKEALFAKRTVAWFDDTLAGPAEFLRPLFFASVEINCFPLNIPDKKIVVAEIKNNSDINLELELVRQPEGFKTTGKVKVEARHTQNIRIEATSGDLINLKTTGFEYKVNNFMISPKENLAVMLNFN